MSIGQEGLEMRYLVLAGVFTQACAPCDYNDWDGKYSVRAVEREGGTCGPLDEDVATFKNGVVVKDGYTEETSDHGECLTQQGIRKEEGFNVTTEWRVIMGGDKEPEKLSGTLDLSILSSFGDETVCRSLYDVKYTKL